MRKNIDFGTQRFRLNIGSEEILLPLEPDTKAAEKQLMTGEEIWMPSEDLTSDCEAVPDSADTSEEELVLTIQENNNESPENYDEGLGDMFAAAVEELSKENDKQEEIKGALRVWLAHFPNETQ